MHLYYQHNLYCYQSLTYLNIVFHNAGEALWFILKSDCNTVRL